MPTKRLPLQQDTVLAEAACGRSTTNTWLLFLFSDNRKNWTVLKGQSIFGGFKIPCYRASGFKDATANSLSCDCIKIITLIDPCCGSGGMFVQSAKLIQAHSGMLTNEQVIEELLNLTKQIRKAKEAGEELGLIADELAFYDALTKPQAIKDFYENEELIAITKELADKLRKNRTIDWQKRDSSRAKMRMLIRKLLKDHRYPPEGMDDAVTTVMNQCELWADNIMSV